MPDGFINSQTGLSMLGLVVNGIFSNCSVKNPIVYNAILLMKTSAARGKMVLQ